MKYKAIVSDIDGTLLNDQLVLSQENYDAIQELMNKGGYFVLSSGRPDAGMKDVVTACGLNEKEGFLIAFNGGKILRTDTGEVLFSEGISHDAFTYYANYAEENDMSIYSYTEEKIIANSVSEGTLLEAKLTGMEYQIESEVANFFENKFIPKTIISSHAEHIKETIEKLQDSQEEQQVELMISNPIFLEVTKKGINKGKALHKLADLLGITVDEIIAVGDGGNDVAMIQEAGLGVAVANASDELRQYADAMTVSNNDHVIAELVKTYFK